jgi:hypothetical protein
MRRARFDAFRETGYRGPIGPAERSCAIGCIDVLENAVRLTLILLVVMLLAFGAHAQSFKWVDNDGKVRYGDVPPPGVKATPMRAPATASPEPAPAAQAGKAATKGPLTPAEQEQEFRRRKEDAAKASEEAARAKREQAEKNEQCDRAREYLRTMESGQVISRVNADGERVALNEAQMAQETAMAREAVQKACK